jgi:hypothetical protein
MMYLRARLFIACAAAAPFISAVPAAFADGATVATYGTCVTYGIDPAAHVAAPQTVVTNSQGTMWLVPHQSVDGNAPPAFSGGWSACSR